MVCPNPTHTWVLEPSRGMPIFNFLLFQSSANSSCRFTDYKLCKFVKMGNIIDDTHNLLASGLEQSVWLESETNVIDVFSPIQASNVHLCHVCVKKFVQSLHCLPLPTSVLYYLVLLNNGLLGIRTFNNHFLAPPVLHRLSNKCVGWIWRYDKSWSQCIRMFVQRVR